MPRPQRIIICTRCGKERPHHSKELCRSCYGYFKRQQHTGHCKQCNQERAGVYSGGVCDQCRTISYKTRKGREFLDKHAARERERRKKFGDVIRQKDHERNIRRRDYRIRYAHDYYQQNKERFKQAHQEWRKTNPGLRDLRKRRYKARKDGLESTLTAQQWQAIKDGFDHCCIYCNRKMDRLTQEHTTPVVQGGAYTEYNILPACQSCNARKHTSTGFEYLIRLAVEKQTGIRVPGPKRNR